MAYDVARDEGAENAQSALVVIKLTPKSNGFYKKEVVNIFLSEGTHDTVQAKFLKQKVKEFKPRILVVDANGVGSGVIDQLVLRLDDGEPPYSVVNNKEYDKYKQPDSVPLIFALKAQEKETKNSDMINRFMTMMNKIDVGLLVNENEGLKAIEAKQKKRIKDSEEIAKIQLPYLYTTTLIEQIMNLRYKMSGTLVGVERISNRIQKDIYSALLYGLFWTYLDEMKNQRKRTDTNIDVSALFSYSRKPKIK